MANTPTRQARCTATNIGNGAVYLEAVLRNVDWSSFNHCWGASFDAAIAADVPSLMFNGAAWLESLHANTLPVKDEVRHWQAHGISTYTTQWQNYKTLGLHDVYSVANAFGIQYDLTLRTLNGSFRVATSTSWKMYWSFASDLWAVASNGSGMTGQSLLRQSGCFAFQNQSLETVLALNGTIPAPLSAVFAEFHRAIGPFGAVDLHHVSTPTTLRLLQRDILEKLGAVLANGTSSGSYPAQHHLASMVLMSTMSPVPIGLDRDQYLCSTGNIFCPEVAKAFNFSLGLSQFTGVDATCYTAFTEWIVVTEQQAVFAVIASGIALASTTGILQACGAEVIAPHGCLESITSVVGFVSTFFSTAELEMYRLRAITAEADILRRGVGFTQFARHIPTNQVQLFFQKLFDPNDPTMMYSSWAFAYDWAVGTREVIGVAGDEATVAIVSALSLTDNFAASEIETPRNVATYFRVLCVYISFVLVAVAIITGFYVLAGRWTTEGLNLFKANRVGGIVWIGRPLLFLRSLDTVGAATVLVASRGSASSVAALVTQVLAAGELGWIVYIFDVMCKVFTRTHAAMYTVKAALSSWVFAAALSIAKPVTHSATIRRRCAVVQMDYEMICHSGVVVIGPVERLIQLVVIALGTSTIGYLYNRVRCAVPPLDEPESHLLSCGALYLFAKKGWVHDGVYYVDFASAVLTGLLVMPYKNDLYVFDVKTWRIHLITRNEIGDATQIHPESRRLAYALPLVLVD
ncbi:hypothetical protein ACHHYP_10515 [Achlya hypogyna]|uniref:Transmembrane protein n=1 Tax=Achlya hypogyna TaxID=1202772 RepID=A0A1V9YL82_ACHHY|nr:hypothetical protein ACHHYP_10515 [Achlya hypogyna]